MGTTRELLKQKREAEAWDEHMARVRAAERDGRLWPVYVPPAEPGPKKDGR